MLYNDYCVKAPHHFFTIHTYSADVVAEAFYLYNYIKQEK